MNSYRPMLAVAGLLVGIVPASTQTPPPRGSDATPPPVSGSKEGTSATQAGEHNPLLLAEVRVVRMPQGRVV